MLFSVNFGAPVVQCYGSYLFGMFGIFKEKIDLVVYLMIIPWPVTLMNHATLLRSVGLHVMTRVLNERASQAQFVF